MSVSTLLLIEFNLGYLKALGLKIHMAVHVIDIPAILRMLKQDYTKSSADECGDSVLSTRLQMKRSMAGASSEALYCVLEQGTLSSLLSAGYHRGKRHTIPLAG